jgi:anti-sigma factor RsiW
MSQFSHRVRFWRDHRWAPRQMSAYLDRELRPRHQVRMKRHLEECAQCRRLLEGLSRMLDALRQLPAQAESVYAAQLAAAVRRRLPPGPAS